jgi:soluble lytic murein transglycosylase-like protein
MLLAGAAFFAPHAGAPPARPAPTAAPIRLIKVEKTPVGLVATTSQFHLGRVPEQPYDAVIKEASRRYGLSVALIRAIIRTESAFDPLAVSRAGAQGLMQRMPALSREMGVKDPFDPRQNIMAGSRYFSSLLAAHNGNLALALASYNAGPGNVARYGGIPPFKETRAYVERITKLVGASRVGDE